MGNVGLHTDPQVRYIPDARDGRLRVQQHLGHVFVGL